MYNHLAEWLTDPRFQEYMGGSVGMKLEILAAIATGGGTGNIAAISKRYGVSRQCGHVMANRARKMVGQRQC
jgi:hypothetical protein